MATSSAPSGSGADRRVFERVPAKIEVRFGHASDAARALRAYSLNFSVGGLCLRTRKTYSIGDVLNLEMKVQGQAFQLVGVVSWARDGAIGVRFQNLTDADRDRLTQLVTTFRK